MRPPVPNTTLTVGNTPVLTLSSLQTPSLTEVFVAAELGAGHQVVTVAVDSGLEYLTGDLYR